MANSCGSGLDLNNFNIEVHAVLYLLGFGNLLKSEIAEGRYVAQRDPVRTSGTVVNDAPNNLAPKFGEALGLCAIDRGGEYLANRVHFYQSVAMYWVSQNS